jgi:hypothetical protein
MAIISSKGVASLKRLYLAMDGQERSDFVEKYAEILNQAPLDFSRNILKERELKAEINQKMEEKHKLNRINKADYYIFNGDYAENLVYFLKKIIQKDRSTLNDEANSPLSSGIQDRLLQPGRQKWFVFTMFAISMTALLSFFIPALLPIVPILMGVVAGMVIISGVWFYKGSSDNTTSKPPILQNRLPQETLDGLKAYMPNQPTSPLPGKNAAPKASDAPEPLVSVSNRPKAPQAQSAPSVEVRGGQSGDPQVSISSRNRR